MSNILSLSKARKAKARNAGNKRSEENRIFFGQTKAEKTLQKTEKARLTAIVEGAKIVAKPPQEGMKLHYNARKIEE